MSGDPKQGDEESHAEADGAVQERDWMVAFGYEKNVHGSDVPTAEVQRHLTSVAHCSVL